MQDVGCRISDAGRWTLDAGRQHQRQTPDARRSDAQTLRRSTPDAKLPGGETCFGTVLASSAAMAQKTRDIQDRAFKFGCEVIEFCDSVPDLRATTRYVLWQLFKAGTSVGSNLEEASAGQSKADFIAKTAVSLKEARESHYWLRVISAKRPALAATANPLLEEADRLVAVLTSILRNARSNPGRG